MLVHLHLNSQSAPWREGEEEGRGGRRGEGRGGEGGEEGKLSNYVKCSVSPQASSCIQLHYLVKHKIILMFINNHNLHVNSFSSAFNVRVHVYTCTHIRSLFHRKMSCLEWYTCIYMLERFRRKEKKERSKQGQTNNKAKQHSTPKAVTFPKKNVPIHLSPSHFINLYCNTT